MHVVFVHVNIIMYMHVYRIAHMGMAGKHIVIGGAL